MNKTTYLIYTLTPTHVGGSEQISVIDLPIQRERHTSFPKFEASSLKGSLRSAFAKISKDEDKTRLLFGADSQKHDKAASIGFTDARTLFFPVKAAKGVFAWITCPLVLHKFITETGFGEEFQDKIDSNIATPESSLFVSNNKVILEEYTFELEKSNEWSEFLKKVANCIFPDKNFTPIKSKFEKDCIIVDNEAFKDFVEHSTEVRTRIKIDPQTRTVQGKAMFNEEYLPEETILYFLAVAHPPPEIEKKEDQILKEFKVFHNQIIQIGANITLGKGFIKLTKLEG